MSIRTVQTEFTTAASSAMISTPNILTSLDLNVAYPPGLALAAFPSEKGLVARTRPHSGATNYSARNFYSNTGPNWNAPRNPNRSTNKRYPQGMRLPSSSHQAQNHYRRSSLSASPTKSMKQEQSILTTPLYQRSSRFDPFGDSKESTLSPPPIVSSLPLPASVSEQPLYTHYYYYDPRTNRPTLAYADDKNPVNAANLTTSTNILLDTLLSGRLDTPRSPSPPPRVNPQQPVVDAPAQPKSRSPSPPHSPRPRAVAISRPNPATTSSESLPVPVRSPAVSTPAAPIKVSKAQRDAIARVVANLLLNRADGPARRVRKCNNSGYVKSGLSRVVSVE